MTRTSVPLPTYPRFLALCFSAISVIFLGSCSWFSSTVEEPQLPAETTSASPTLEPPAPPAPVSTPLSGTSDLELVWLVPEEQVDRFVVEYGYSDKELDQQVELDPKLLQISDDAKHGKVFRYVLHGIPKNKEIFLTLRSVKGSTRSEPTPVFTVKAE